MKLKPKNILFLVLALAWMGLIFYFSAQKDVVSQQESRNVGKLYFGLFNWEFEGLPEEEQLLAAERLDLIVRKCAHMFEYFVLGVLLCLALKDIAGRPYLTALCLSVLYACSDEFHQLFVQGRSGEVRDVLIDSGGALLGLLMLRLIRLSAEKRKKQQDRPE